jgi:uncharacterized protein YndB with AHSA1/START domain
MIEGTFPVTIQAPPDAVWPWISQLEKHAEWSPKPYTFEWLSGEPNAVGSRYRSVGSIPTKKHNVNEGEITASVPNERFALRAEDPQGVFLNTFTLRPAGSGTEVVFHLVFPPMKQPMSAMASMLFATLGKADIRKRMQLLKQKVEAVR